MNRVFSIQPPFRVPDGTWLSPFLNAKDSESGLPFGLLDGFSLSAGTIDPKSCSKIHVMPFVTQVTFVRSGNLAVRMKGPNDLEPYNLHLTAGQAVLTEPGAFFQIINEGSDRCEVLYIVSPAYVFEKNADGTVLYDDSIMLDQDWDELAATGWQIAQSKLTTEQRASALQRLAKIKFEGAEA